MDMNSVVNGDVHYGYHIGVAAFERRFFLVLVQMFLTSGDYERFRTVMKRLRGIAAKKIILVTV